MKMKRSIGEIIWDWAIIIVLTFLTIITLYPVWYVLVASFSDGVDITKNPGIMLWPKHFVTGAYSLVFQHPLLMNGLLNSIKVLVISLPINIVLTLFCGYFMASSKMMFKKPIISMILFTMFFGGGLIPSYLNIQSLGLKNTLWVLIIPGALSVYNSIICKTAIEAVPASLSESAFIDGANDLQIIFRIILPIIKPAIAVLVLYYGVGHWNSWFTASIYIKKESLLPIQNIIREILIINSPLSGGDSISDDFSAYEETIKYAAIVVSTVPIMCVYPFLQKYFAKGVMIGAIKG